jgi:hypothetical protein
MDMQMTRRFFSILKIFVLAGTVTLPIRAVTEVTSKFEVYCDGLGIFLVNVDGAPAPGKLVLFSGVSFPPGTAIGLVALQEKWSDAYVLPDGCVPDGKCESNGKGGVWIDKWDDNASGATPRLISGKYEIEVNGKKLRGTFAAKLFSRKKPIRLCE